LSTRFCNHPDTPTRRARIAAVAILTVVAAMLWTPARATAQPSFLGNVDADGEWTNRSKMNVIVRDLTGVSPAVIERAKRVAAGVYRRIGVDITWFGAGDLVQQVPTDSALNELFCASVIQVNLLPADPEDTLHPPFRATTVGMAAPGSRFARVLVQRIRVLAVQERIDVGRVLGYVMAHEIGHLLLPPNSHSRDGLMSALLDLTQVRRGSLWFDEDQAARIRGTLVRRGVSLASEAAGI